MAKKGYLPAQWGYQMGIDPITASSGYQNALSMGFLSLSDYCDIKQRLQQPSMKEDSVKHNPKLLLL